MAKSPAEDQGRSETLNRIRTYFEGKEAIYIEKGALRVRVSNIRFRDGGPAYRAGDYIEAHIEEIPTPGLPVNLPGFDRRAGPRPLRWKIGTNIRVHPGFSPSYWSGPAYTGWSMHFWPKLIEGVVGLASGFPQDQTPYRGYRQVLDYINNQAAESLRAFVKRAQSS
jgi:hypothetical protein